MLRNRPGTRPRLLRSRSRLRTRPWQWSRLRLRWPIRIRLGDRLRGLPWLRLRHRRSTRTRPVVRRRRITGPVIRPPGWAIRREFRRRGWTIIRWAIVPVAAISRATVIRHRPWAIPDVRRTVRVSPSDPDRVIVVAPVRGPVPAPSHPSPRPRAHIPKPDRNCRPVTHNHNIRRRPDVNHCRVVDRHINHLRVCRLNHVDRLPG